MLPVSDTTETIRVNRAGVNVESALWPPFISWIGPFAITSILERITSPGYGFVSLRFCSWNTLPIIRGKKNWFIALECTQNKTNIYLFYPNTGQLFQLYLHHVAANHGLPHISWFLLLDNRSYRIELNLQNRGKCAG